MAESKTETNSTFVKQKKGRPITLLKVCHVVQTNMNS